MPKTYPVEARVFAIRQRQMGRPWNEIAAALEEKYGISPGRRVMLNWIKATAFDSVINETMRKAISEAVREAALQVAADMTAKDNPDRTNIPAVVKVDKDYGDTLVARLQGKENLSSLLRRDLAIFEEKSSGYWLRDQLISYIYERWGIQSETTGWSSEVRPGKIEGGEAKSEG